MHNDDYCSDYLYFVENHERDEYAPMGDELQFITKEKKPVSDKPIKVRVSDRWSIVHEGKRYIAGETVTVPEHLAEDWERSRWVERVTTGK
jgi:hypothetical protein